MECDALVRRAAEPNDYYYVSPYVHQWALNGLYGMNCPAAWDISTGSDSVVVGVVDTGFQYTHPDLAGNIWTNPGETAGDGIDNDGNGYIDDVYGANFIDTNGEIIDDNGHGTGVAGVLGRLYEKVGVPDCGLPDYGLTRIFFPTLGLDVTEPAATV